MKLKNKSIDTKDLTQRLFNQPTAPFREHFVLEEIKAILKEYQIPFFEDTVGQIVAGVSNPQKLKSKPHVAFFAHTDHPGFIINQKISPTRYKATWYGGAPFNEMERKPVRIFSLQDSNKYQKGVIRNFVIGNHRKGITFEIETSKELDNKLLKQKGYFGAFNFDGFKYKPNGLVHTKCADDLAGCVMALGALISLKQLKQSVPAIAVFTRAEEVGFVGCLHLIKSKVISKNTMVVSLEASKTLPNALLGEGPVIRLGDASTLFDSNFSLYMQKQAQNLKGKDKNFKFQKRIMDGGSCEATALSQFGYKTMGLAVPLKNYHNQGTKGPAPEIIHINDIENGRVLLAEIAKNLKTFKSVGPNLQKRLMTNLTNLNKML